MSGPTNPPEVRRVAYVGNYDGKRRKWVIDKVETSEWAVFDTYEEASNAIVAARERARSGDPREA